MNDQYMKNVVEAALLAAGRPLSLDELVGLFDERDESKPADVRAALAALNEDYTGRGIELHEVASGFRIQIKAEVAQPVSRLWQERPAKYSRALLETLALVAYRQPITRGEIEQIRGVAVNPNIIKTLLERSWIRVVGHRDVPGKPELLGTTKDFLDYFGLKKLDDLPTLAQLKELEDLRVQLSLPGAEPAMVSPAPEDGAVQAGAVPAGAVPGGAVQAGAVPAGTMHTGAAQDDEEQFEDPEERAAGHSQGLVARGVQDDAH